MGANKRDWEDRVIDKANDLALERYNLDFNDISPSLQMQTWIDAEHIVNDQLANQMDAARDAYREHSAEYWQEMELSRRLGK